ncbi:hypothetical protein IJT93_03475 [bacterium]|nr:hypothetical protein [bacterium]
MINSIGSPDYSYNANGIGSKLGSIIGHKPETAEFSYNAQDDVVMSDGTAKVDDVKVGLTGKLSTPRTKMKDKIKPNEDGKYVYDRKTQPKEFAAAHTFATVNNTLKMFEEAYGEKVPWAFKNDQMKINADKGEMLNAYYSRFHKSVNFFHAMDPVTNQMVYSGTSGEVVSHEVGHAMLDGLHPEYLACWSPDPRGFHEHFADMTGFMMATQDDATCELVAKETGGDLKKPNSLALTGESLGVTIGHATGSPRNCIRDANNEFLWQDPSTLPQMAPDDQLCTEMHSWSRVYTGAMYDAFAGMVSRNMGEGQSCEDAIKSCGKEFINLYAATLKEAPKGDFTYHQMANCMLKVDREQFGGRNREFLLKGFIAHNIIPDDLSIMEAEPDTGAKNVRTMTVTLGDDCGMFSGAKVDTLVDADKMFMSEADSPEAKSTQAHVKKLIEAGRILYTEPNQVVSSKDLFDKNGVPYDGVVRWVDGSMTIERNTIIN